MKLIHTCPRWGKEFSRVEIHKDDKWEAEFHAFCSDLHVTWIHVIPFQEAPEFLRVLSKNEGDEDWLVLTSIWHNDWMVEQSFIDRISNDIQRIEAGEWVIYIGSHA